MSFWSHNIELMDEITAKNLPEPWYTRVMEGAIELYDVPEKVRDGAFIGGEREFWADRVDEAKLRGDEMRLQRDYEKTINALTKYDRIAPDGVDC